MVTVMHTRLRSQTIITSSGPMTLDSEGHFEVSESVAAYLCDEAKYSGTFERVGNNGSLPAEEAEEVLEAAEEEEPAMPVRKKKVRRKKKISKKVRA